MTTPLPAAQRLIADVDRARDSRLRRVADLTALQGAFMPTPEEWSAREILAHLLWAGLSGVATLWEALSTRPARTPARLRPHRGLPIELIIAATSRPRESAQESATPHLGGPVECWMIAMRSLATILAEFATPRREQDVDDVVVPQTLPTLGPSMLSVPSPIRRGFGLASVALLLGACATAGRGASSPELPTGFPTRCEPDAVQVMLLGTYHFAAPGNDAVRQRIDDVLTARRQAELDELATRLAKWDPDQIAVEWPFTFRDSTVARFARFSAGTLTPTRNEVVQIGFRLARRLRHDTVHPIDAEWPIWNDSLDALALRRPDLAKARDSILAAQQAMADAASAHAMSMRIVDQLRDANSEAAFQGGNSLSMFGSFLPAGEGENYGGPQLLAQWYARNFRIAHHLTRVLRPGTKRVLVIVGAGHVPPLRNILHESPHFCPVSPLPYLR